MCNVLPAYHDFTGDDYESAFNRKGKVNPLKLLIEDPRSMEAFRMLGLSETLSQDLINGISRLTCRMYSTAKPETKQTVLTRGDISALCQRFLRKERFKEAKIL